MARFSPQVAKSDPREARFILQYTRNGVCIREVMECLNMDAITYEVNGEPQEVLCCNPETGADEVVAIIEQGGTKRVQFDLERLLPRNKLSNFMRIVADNCNTLGYLARGDECADPTDPDQFKILDSFGQLRFGPYSRSASVSRTKADAAAITESTTVYAYDWKQYGRQDIGRVTTPPHSQAILDVAHCDRKVCGALCEYDSDGCQRWLTVQADGLVGYTVDQYATGGLSIIPPAQLGGATAAGICCTRNKVVVYDTNGNIHTADIATVITGQQNPSPWTTIANDSNNADIPALTDCGTDKRGNIWFTSGALGVGRVYQYQPGTNRVVNLGAITGNIAEQRGIAIKDDTVIITGVGFIARSNNGGRTFSTVTIDPVPAGVTLPAGTEFLAPVIIDRENWMVGTNNGYTLYTTNNGRTFQNMSFTGMGAGVINDIAFDNNTRLYMSHSATAGGPSTLHSSYYATCANWNLLPETSDPLPANNGINRIAACPEDGNVFVAVGASTTASGLIVRGTTQYE